MTDPNGSLTTVSVDALGRTSSVWLPLRPQLSNPDSPSMSFTYTLSQTAPNKVETKKFTGGGIVSEFQFFDGLGRLVQTQRAAAGGGAVVKTTNYDHQGREYFVDSDYWTDSMTPGAGFFTPVTEDNIPSQTITSYDAVGRATKTVLKTTGTVRSQTLTSYTGADRVDSTPPTGGTATSVFTDSLGQKTKLTQYLGGTPTGTGQSTTYAYDGGGRMTQMTDPAGNTWTWSFDLLGNRTGQSDPDSGTSTATYDLVGNMTSTTDARGKLVTTTFDELNRKTAMYAGTASGSKLAAWVYDTVKKGLVTSSTSYVGSTPSSVGLAYTSSVGSYDAADNPLQQTVSIPAGAPAFAGTTYTTTSYYHPDSTLLGKAVPAAGGLPSETIRYTYDSRGALSGIRGASMVLANTVYTPLGQLSQFNRYNGTNNGYSTYGYDVATGAVLTVTDNAVFNGSGHYVADRAYSRDDAGNVTSSTTVATHPTAQTQKVCYTYDGLRQLTRAWTPNTTTACSATPSASAMGGPAPYWLEYAYDNATGNRKSVTSKTAAGTSTTSTFTYPDAGSARPHGVSAVSGGAGAGSYGYDAAGNQTARPGQTVTYGDTGKVVKVIAGSEAQANIFDADGNLLVRTSSTGGSALFLGDMTMTQAAGSTVVAGFRTYVGAEGKPVAQRSAKTGTAGSTLSWLFTTLEGTVDVQTDAVTGTTVRQHRDPFGAPVGASSQGWPNGAGYMNKQVADKTKLTNVGARTYDPVLGKFLSVDPVIDTNLPQQNTGYTYSGNNPTTYSDPSGLKFYIEGYKPPSSYSKPPGFYSIKARGKAYIAAGAKKMKKNAYNILTEPWAKIGKKNEARAQGYALYNYGQALTSEQGALVYQWIRGNLPQRIAFNDKSEITRGLRASPAATEYRSYLRASLRSGAPLQDHYYRAGDFTLKNPNVVRDIKTTTFWEQASNADRSLAILGSHNYSSRLVTRLTDSSAVVQITAENPMTLGSALSPVRELADSIPAATGPLSAVTMTFTWTETVSW
ncbi:RHS repeat-associated protein [Microbacterium esteraromaticum]|uniref:RHS repeat-associated core domain-containing protein n=2 Tax=Microbacterium esteraromaticum TaxID=57043 RepID=UPI001958191C|nr:RHS repeat-associated protein [Microbacterium esteraromaticum]